MRTQLSSKHKYVLYLTKHLRKDLHDRMRVQAALRGSTIEDILNLVLAVGLPNVEVSTEQEHKMQER